MYAFVPKTIMGVGLVLKVGLHAYLVWCPPLSFSPLLSLPFSSVPSDSISYSIPFLTGIRDRYPGKIFEFAKTHLSEFKCMLHTDAAIVPFNFHGCDYIRPNFEPTLKTSLCIIQTRENKSGQSLNSGAQGYGARTLQRLGYSCTSMQLHDVTAHTSHFTALMILKPSNLS
jgi:hypothetical protein